MSHGRILVDDRERPSGVPDLLKALGAKVEMAQLPLGDYVISDRLVVERKAGQDLLSSLYDGRLFQQCERLSEGFEQPLLLMELDLATLPQWTRNVRAIYGALVSIILHTKVKLLYSPGPRETAELIVLLAKHADRSPKRPSLRSKGRKGVELRRRQLQLVASLPGVGEVLAERLLQRFKSPKGVFLASMGAIANVEGMGEAKARRIREVLSSPYKAVKEGRLEV